MTGGSPHQGRVSRDMFPFDDVTMYTMAIADLTPLCNVRYAVIEPNWTLKTQYQNYLLVLCTSCVRAKRTCDHWGNWTKLTPLSIIDHVPQSVCALDYTPINTPILQ